MKKKKSNVETEDKVKLNFAESRVKYILVELVLVFLLVGIILLMFNVLI
ncbi:MAG: hypothetical protein ACOC2F_01320 [Bacteroidota bacterium]